jgi:pimeloyl-ACP methyl ester carboxylesterase
VLLAPDGLEGEEGVWLAATELGTLLEAGFSRTNRSMIEIALRTVIFGDTTAVRPDVVDSFAEQFDTREGVCALAAITRDVIGHDPVDEVLPRIGQETLLLWGTDDRLLRPRWAQKFLRLLPRCELAMLEGCGHELMLEDPEAVAGLVRAFLSR